MKEEINVALPGPHYPAINVVRVYQSSLRLGKYASGVYCGTIYHSKKSGNRANVLAEKVSTGQNWKHSHSLLARECAEANLFTHRDSLQQLKEVLRVPRKRKDT